MPRLSRRTKKIAFGAALLAGWAGSGFLVWQASYAAFSATTVNNGNSWSAGTVALTDDDSNSAMFTVTALKPGDTDEECIEVNYTGTLAADVKLYSTAAHGGTGLDTYLDITIEEGDGGEFGDCTGFAADGTIYTGTLAGFRSAPHTNYGNAVGTWAPGSAETKTYKFTYTLQDNNAAQSLTTTAGFTWEAQNS